MKKYAFLITMFISLLSCNSEITEKTNDSEPEENVCTATGEWHNTALENAFIAIQNSPIVSSTTRNAVTAEEYAKCLASAQAAILKDLNKIQSMSHNEIPSYIQRRLDITLSEASIKSIHSLLTDPNYSLTKELKKEFPNEMSSTIEGYLDEMINTFKNIKNMQSLKVTLIRYMLNGTKWQIRKIKKSYHLRLM